MSDQNQKISGISRNNGFERTCSGRGACASVLLYKKARMLVAKQEAQLGRPLTFVSQRSVVR